MAQKVLLSGPFFFSFSFYRRRNITNVDDRLIGKHILVGLTYLDDAGKVTGQLQLHGNITRVGEHTIRFERADGAGEFSIPDDGGLTPGDPGAVYRLSSTGEHVTDVDFVASWTIPPPRESE